MEEAATRGEGRNIESHSRRRPASIKTNGIPCFQNQVQHGFDSPVSIQLIKEESST